MCGSCWVFSTIGPLECLIKIKDGKTVDLSEQWLVSCNKDGYSCRGGFFAHGYLTENGYKKDLCGDSGAVMESAFPYQAKDWRDLPCNCPYEHKYFIDSWSVINGNNYDPPSDEAMKQAIYDHGPISVALCAGQALIDYTGGVFETDESHLCNGNANHAVVLTGWNDNQECWIMRNSWGTGWGEGGYPRIKYGTSNIGYAATYIRYGGPPNPPTGPDLICSGSLIWRDAEPTTTVTGSFTVKNIGESGSNLNWKISQYPTLGSMDYKYTIW
jgi:C1A family cysteine protease